jgi:hypothetical protein
MHIGPYECKDPFVEVDPQVHADFADFLGMYAKIHDTDFVEHLWRLKGEASIAPTLDLAQLLFVRLVAC